MNKHMDRRKYLSIVGITVSTVVAGCGSNGGDQTTDSGDSGNSTSSTERDMEETDTQPTDTRTSYNTTTPEQIPSSTPTEQQTPQFEFQSVNPTDKSFSEPGEIPIEAIVTNTGNAQGQRTIKLQIRGRTLEEKISLEVGENTTVGTTMNWNDFGPGTVNYAFDSDDDEISGEFTVEKGVFNIVSLLSDSRTVKRGETTEIGVRIENTGNIEKTETVILQFAGERVGELELSLKPGENTLVTQEIDTGILEPRVYEYTFTIDDDEIDGSLQIEEPNIDEPPNQSFSGTGQSVESGIDIQGGFTVIEATHDGRQNFQVSLVDDSEFDDLFINTIGEFGGESAKLVDSGEYLLDVTADGYWEVTIKQPRAVTGKQLPLSHSGTGSEVIGPFEFEGTHIASGSHSGERNYIVEVYPMKGEFSELVFNEIGTFEGETTFSHQGIGWIVIRSEGEWSLTID